MPGHETRRALRRDRLSCTGDVKTRAVRPDQFATHSAPSPAAREFLKWSRENGKGAATLDEIYQGMFDGGFPFESRDLGSIKNGLKIALAKDKQVELLPNGYYVLTSWTGRVKRPEGKGGAASRSADEPEASEPAAMQEAPPEDPHPS